MLLLALEESSFIQVLWIDSPKGSGDSYICDPAQRSLIPPSLTPKTLNHNERLIVCTKSLSSVSLLHDIAVWRDRISLCHPLNALL